MSDLVEENVPTIVMFCQNGSEATDDEQAVFEVMQECFDLMVQRNRGRNGVWRRSGVRGQTHEVHAKGERAYMDAFVSEKLPDRDHFRDIVNYSIFAMILLDKLAKAGGDEAPQSLRDQTLYGNWPHK